MGNYLSDDATHSRTRAISGSQPWAIHTARFYRESAASLGSPQMTAAIEAMNCSGWNPSRSSEDAIVATEEADFYPQHIN
jgi:hypothetical protein